MPPETLTQVLPLLFERNSALKPLLLTPDFGSGRLGLNNLGRK